MAATPALPAIAADGDEGAALPAAHAEEGRPPSPTADEVAGYAGTLEQAFEAGMLEPPPPLEWNQWHQWRTATATRPASLRLGTGGDREARIWRRVMMALHGPDWRRLAREHPAEERARFLEDVARSPESLAEAREQQPPLSPPLVSRPAESLAPLGAGAGAPLAALAPTAAGRGALAGVGVAALPAALAALAD